MDIGRRPCVWCWFARDRRDVAGVYCTGGFARETEQQCSHYLDYTMERNRRRKESAAKREEEGDDETI